MKEYEIIINKKVEDMIKVKDINKLIDEFDFKKFLIRKERDIRRYSPFHPQVISEKIKYALKSKITGKKIDYLKLIIQSRKDDGLDYSTEYAILKKLEELKQKITGEKEQGK